MTEFIKQPQTDKILTNLKTKKLGKRNAIFHEIGSTNTYLKGVAAVLDDGFTVISASQTGGRGRLGKTFESPPGGLYMSVLIKDLHGEDVASATVKAAVAVCEALEEYLGLPEETLGIKWVNDILYDGKKLCGILCEFVRTEKGDCLIIGIGVNILSTSDILSEAIKDSVCGLADVAQAENIKGGAKGISEYAREEVCAQILGKLEKHLYQKLENCIDAYRDRSVVVGKDIYVIKGGETKPAHAYGITDDAKLCVHYGDGRFEMLGSGDVSIRRTNV